MFEADKGQAAPLKGQELSIGIVQARFNEGVTNALAAACIAATGAHGAHFQIAHCAQLGGEFLHGSIRARLTLADFLAGAFIHNHNRDVLDGHLIPADHLGVGEGYDQGQDRQSAQQRAFGPMPNPIGDQSGRHRAQGEDEWNGDQR